MHSFLNGILFVHINYFISYFLLRPDILFGIPVDLGEKLKYCYKYRDVKYVSREANKKTIKIPKTVEKRNKNINCLDDCLWSARC